MEIAMKIKLCAALSVIALLGVAPFSSADTGRWERESRRSDTEMRSRDLRSLENFLDSHWRVAQRLYEDPDLVNDRQFVRNNESLDDWLDAHPDAADVLRENPHKYLWQGRASSSDRMTERELQRMTARELRNFENFLDTNPETARRLYEDPDLINDRQFVRSREGLSDWLARNPDAAQALRDNPHRFLWRERSVSVGDFLSQLLQPSAGSPSTR